jgi:hypothetical protein
MRALALKKDAKAQMSNTCPNIAQVLSSLDSNNSKNQGPHGLNASNRGGHNTHSGIETHRPVLGTALLPSNQVALNFHTINS